MPPSILVADDDVAFGVAIAETLRAEGYEVYTAADGLVALGIATERRPDIVLTDIVMPGLSGPELFARLRLQGIYVPVVLMSAYAHGLEGTTTPVLRKPFDLDEFLTMVADLLGQSRGTRHRAGQR